MLNKENYIKYILCKFGDWHLEWFGSGRGWYAPMYQDLSILKFNLLLTYLISLDNELKLKVIFDDFYAMPLGIYDRSISKLIEDLDYIDFGSTHFDKIIPNFEGDKFTKIDVLFDLDMVLKNYIDSLFIELIDKSIHLVSRSAFYLCDLSREWLVHINNYSETNFKKLNYEDIINSERKFYTF